MFSETLQYLLNMFDIEKNLDNDSRIEMYDQLLVMLDDPILNMIKMDIIYALKEFETQLKQQHNIDALRKLKNKCKHYVNIYIPEFRPSFYNNKQNVHLYVAETVRIAQNILKLYPAKYKRPFRNSFFIIIESAELFQEEIDLKLLFASIYKFIQESIYKEELMKRLIEEMNESETLCVSGHICRLINTIRGFTDDLIPEKTDQLVSKIDEYEYERAKTFYEITNKVDVFLIDGLMDRIKKAVNSGVISIDNRFGAQILSEYTKEKWEIRNGIYDCVSL